MSPEPSAIIFDLDGTLVDSAPDLTAALNHVLQQAGRQAVTISHVRHLVSNGARAMITKGFSAGGPPPDDNETDAILRDFLKYYEQNIADRTTIFPGALSVVKKLVDSGIPLGLCSNKSLRLARKLVTEIGLADYFSALTGGDSFDFKKPDPRHVTATLDLMKCPHDRAIMVGDSANDIIAAHKAGITAIGVSFGYSIPPVADFNPDMIIDHYDGFFDAMTKITRNFS